MSHGSSVFYDYADTIVTTLTANLGSLLLNLKEQSSEIKHLLLHLYITVYAATFPFKSKKLPKSGYFVSP